MCIAGVDPGGINRFDRGGAHADERHIGLVESLKVVAVCADSFGSNGMVIGNQQVGDRRVGDHRPDLLLVELACLLVGHQVGHLVGEGLGVEHTAQLPTLFERRPALLRGEVHGRLGGGDVRRSAAAAPRQPAALRVAGLDLGELLAGQRSVARRDAVVGRALEDVQVRGLLCDDRNRLNARGSGSDDRHPLAGEINVIIRPVRGVVDLATEGVQAAEVRGHRGRQRSRGHQAEPCCEHLTGIGGDRPAQCGLVEHRRDDTGVERDVAAQVEFVGDPVQVGEDLGLGGVLLGPVPLLLQFVGERIAVIDALDVAARARIPVEVPGAAQFGRGLDHPDREPLRA